MMRFIAPFLVFLSFVALTDLHGFPLWIERAEVAAVAAPTSCDKGAGAKVVTLSGPFCVRENVGDAVKKLGGIDGVGERLSGVHGN